MTDNYVRPITNKDFRHKANEAAEQTSVMPDPVEATSFKEDAATTATRQKKRARDLQEGQVVDAKGSQPSLQPNSNTLVYVVPFHVSERVEAHSYGTSSASQVVIRWRCFNRLTVQFRWPERHREALGIWERTRWQWLCSDAEDNEEDRDEDGEDENTEATEEDQDKVKEDVRLGAEDTKKPKLQKIVVDDGESGEATVLAVRAKMYQLENKEVGWKERGAGMLKLNIPKSAIEFDASGTADITSFDPSGLEDNDEAEPKKSKSVRLLMRQDHTLRLLLNTTVVPAVKFQLIPKLKAAHVLFTAFEANEVKQVQMKMSEANANLLMDHIKFIQGCLADV
ncbi:hypothetical protein P8C59_001423 [Phyllachora maydis]|uniref:RanBD1 domain-containing protein n=1 Tax=Phyllachora maydis TaxID=1825666 RepID=A0AAD9MA81_9PEZI|nr:hypothetical protein P8C59_001423 [Phyllachora maydis]